MKSKLVTLALVLAGLALVAPPVIAQPNPVLLATGAGAGGGPHVEVFTLNPDGTLTSPTPATSFFAYAPDFTGGVQVALGRVLANGADLHLVTAAGTGGGPHVRIFDLTANGTLVSDTPAFEFFAYDATFTGGVNIAICNLDGGLFRALLTAPASGDQPVKVWSISNGTGGLLGAEPVDSFTPFPGFVGGVRLACGPLDTNPLDSVVTGAGPGGGPHVIVRGSDGTEIVSGFPVEDSFFAFAPDFTGGVYVAAGNIDGAGTGVSQLIVAADAGGGPHVKIFHDPSGAGLVSSTLVDQTFAYAANFTGGVRPAGSGDISGLMVTAPGPGGGPHIKVFQDTNADGIVSDEPTASEFFAYAPTFGGGVNVAIGVFVPIVPVP